MHDLMIAPVCSPVVQQFIDGFRERSPSFAKELEATRAADAALFDELAAPILEAVSRTIGHGWIDVLSSGYAHFVIDVNRSQAQYEKRGHYANKSYDEVYRQVYGNAAYMDKYHWGVLVSSFIWTHHLRIYRYYRDYFLDQIPNGAATLLDLGAGSGLWHILALRRRPMLRATAVDISARSIALAAQMARSLGIGDQVTHLEGDALNVTLDTPFDVGTCCFLAEHLEKPQALLPSLARNLKTGGLAFVTAALTAAEIDHIAEFRRESEIVDMAESAGFRVLGLFSSAPDRVAKPDALFLPRSLAVVLQKRRGAFW
jgi:SAM-dependent methyltransferase